VSHAVRLSVARRLGGACYRFADLRLAGAFAHGGTGGTPATLALGSGEYPVSLYVCQGSYNGGYRLFYARWTTNLGHTLSGGTTTSDCTTFTAPSGYEISGFFGRDGREVDKLGVFYTKIS
jgi:hypothetical protein